MTVNMYPQTSVKTMDFPLTRAIPMRSVPNRPAISNVLIKASANIAFRTKLLTRPEEALAEMNLPFEDAEILKSVHAPTLKDYAHQIKEKLLVAHA